MGTKSDQEFSVLIEQATAGDKAALSGPGPCGIQNAGEITGSKDHFSLQYACNKSAPPGTRTAVSQ